MNSIYEKLTTCLASVREKTDFVPETAIVLGSGLGDYAEQIKIETTIDYKDIKGFPTSTVPGHKGRFVFGYVDSVPVVIMQGRVHYYEGYPITDVVLPTRLMGMMGAKKLILTRGSGISEGKMRIYEQFQKSLSAKENADFLKNEYGWGGAYPVIVGANIDELGERFPDMSEVYSRRMREIVKEKADKLGIKLREGVYVQLTGPQYETPAEVRMCKILGGDAVGMSTACEALAARHMGLEVCGISCITNLAAGLSDKKLNHKEVQETADRVAKQFTELITAVVRAV